jgi:radical SAM protein with 4Fe4S-binding SPASM domain
MEWNSFRDNLGLNPVTAGRLREILVRLQHRFFDLCARAGETAGEPIIERLAAHLATPDADQDGTSDFLVGMLRQETINGSSKMDLLIDMEKSARIDILSELSGIQRERFLYQAPESLLDIDPGDNPFSAYLESRFGSPAPAGFVCRSPYEYAHVQANGDVYPCCPSKFGKIIGSLLTQSLTEIWNSPEARSVRASIEQGDYRYCNAEACEYLRKANAEHTPLSPAPLVSWLRNKGLLSAGAAPKIINLGSDKTCNLACSYCRTELYRLTPTEKQRIKRIDSNIFDELGDDIERLVLLGEGDPFASPVYLDKLRTYDWTRHKKLKIKLQTNGLLLTPAMWASISNSHGLIDWISVSIDAATPETYRLNRGGDFKKLLSNLEFIAALRAQGLIRRFWINFLVLNNNYREMPDFALLGTRLGCDLIEFQRIENWGILNEEQYRDIAVHETWHPNHAGLERVLLHPALKNKGVWLLKISETMNESAEMNIISWDE